MAEDETPETGGEDSAEESAKPTKGRKLAKLALFSLFFAVSFAAGAAFNHFTFGTRTVVETVEVEKVEEIPEPFYTEFDPSFTVNIPGENGTHYLDLTLSALSFDRDSYAILREYRPLLRNKLLLTISNRQFEELLDGDGREQLRIDLHEAIDDILLQAGQNIKIEKVFFTKFLLQ